MGSTNQSPSFEKGRPTGAALVEDAPDLCGGALGSCQQEETCHWQGCVRGLGLGAVEELTCIDIFKEKKHIYIYIHESCIEM